MGGSLKAIIKKHWKWVAILTSFALIWYAFFLLPNPLFEVPYSSAVYGEKGDLLGARIAVDEQWRFEPTDSLPQDFIHAIITFEDSRFFTHPGVDPLAIARAFRENSNANRVVSGASTITMQVMRLAYGAGERSWYRKILESIAATRLEWTYSKNEILALYAAHAPFGGNVVGLEAASWRYFGRSPFDLSLAECATLAVLPNAPSLVHPGRNRDELKFKRDQLLWSMVEEGYTDSSAVLLAILEPLPGVPKALPQHAYHLVEELRTRNENKSWHTTIHSEWQLRAEEILNKYAGNWISNHVYNASVLIVDVKTGEVKVDIGNLLGSGVDDKINMTRKPRSTGSLLKPMLYAYGLSEGIILPQSLLADIPTRYGNYRPMNFNKDFSGAVRADEALIKSLNIPAVRLLEEFGTSKFLNGLKNMGMSDLDKRASYYGLSLIIGGGEVSPWQIAEGYRHFLFPVYDIQEASEIHVLKDEFKTHLVNRSALPGSGATYATLNAMKQLNLPHSEDGRPYFGGASLAWKTGTSFGFRDAWAVGYNGQYIIVVWIGNSSNEGRPGVIGVETAAPVLFNLVDILPPAAWPEEPIGDFVKVSVCKHSGYLAGPNCASIENQWVPNQGGRSNPCPYCVSIAWNGVEQVKLNCYSGPISDTSWFVLPPDMEWYYSKRHADYNALPKWKVGCEENEGDDMTFIYPENGEKIILSRNVEGKTGKVVFELAHRNLETLVYWHLDNAFVGQTTGTHKLALLPDLGEHVLYVIDENGHSKRIFFEVLIGSE